MGDEFADFPTHLSLDDASARVREAVEAHLARTETEVVEVRIWEARGGVLARDVPADRDQPPFDRSAMDGFAFRSADVGEEGATLRVVGEVPAGTSWGEGLGRGEAVAIMTGAPVPDDADAVQMVEKTRRDGDRVFIEGPVRPGQHIAPRGEDVREGETVVEAGTVVDGIVVGVLASVGCSRVPVRRRPRVNVMATGDELVGLDETPGPHQIRDSNRHTLMALLADHGCSVVDGGRIEDEPQTLRRAIRAGLASEVLVLSGGVSAGVYDYVLEALRDEGVEILFHKVTVKPGKPILVGQHPGGLVFGLPGNPVSAFVMAHLVLAPAVARLGGRPCTGPWHARATLLGDLPATGGRLTFHPGRVHPAGLERSEADDELAPWDLIVESVEWNGSGDQVGYGRGNCLVRREPGSPGARSGEVVTVMLLHPPAL